ncbi:MAG: hypothetical protein AABY22_01390 [Nanoarchaeota archaeon]
MANKNIKPQIYSTKVLVENDNLVIKLPKNIGKYLKISDSKIFWVPINGTIQIMSNEPKSFIPITALDKNDFIVH